MFGLANGGGWVLGWEHEPTSPTLNASCFGGGQAKETCRALSVHVFGEKSTSLMFEMVSGMVMLLEAYMFIIIIIGRYVGKQRD